MQHYEPPTLENLTRLGHRFVVVSRENLYNPWPDTEYYRCTECDYLVFVSGGVCHVSTRGITSSYTCRQSYMRVDITCRENIVRDIIE